MTSFDWAIVFCFGLVIYCLYEIGFIRCCRDRTGTHSTAAAPAYPRGVPAFCFAGSGKPLRGRSATRIAVCRWLAFILQHPAIALAYSGAFDWPLGAAAIRARMDANRPRQVPQHVWNGAGFLLSDHDSGRLGCRGGARKRITAALSEPPSRATGRHAR